MEAVTREEMFLAAAAGEDVDTPEPVTRREMFLQQVANNAASRYFETTGGDTITWDGNTEGLVSGDGLFYKISDAVPTMEDFADGASVTVNIVGEIIELSLSAEDVIEIAYGVFCLVDSFAVFVPESAVGVDIDGIAFSQAGTYFIYNPGEWYTASLTIPGYTGFETVKLKEELLPELVTYVTVTEGEDGTFSADKTFGEIMAIIWSGKTVVLRMTASGEGVVCFYLAAFSETTAIFCALPMTGVMKFTVTESGITYLES